MSTYEFTIRLDRDPEPYIDALGELGCTDALFIGDADGRGGAAEFVRDADSLWSAVVRATGQILGAGLRPVDISIDTLETASGLAALLGVTRQRIGVLRKRPDFPRAAMETGKTELYSRVEVVSWARERALRETEVDVGTPDERLAVSYLSAKLAEARLEELLDQGKRNEIDSLLHTV